MSTEWVWTDRDVYMANVVRYAISIRSDILLDDFRIRPYGLIRGEVRGNLCVWGWRNFEGMAGGCFTDRALYDIHRLTVVSPQFPPTEETLVNFALSRMAEVYRKYTLAWQEREKLDQTPRRDVRPSYTCRSEWFNEDGSWREGYPEALDEEEEEEDQQEYEKKASAGPTEISKRVPLFVGEYDEGSA